MDTPEKFEQIDKSRNATSNRINERIDDITENNIRQLYPEFKSDEVDHRIEELENEWDIDRTLMANASTLSLAGVVLGSTVNRNWFILPGVVATFLLWHAVQGWCPPLPVFRKLGYRSRKEIYIEKFVIKALRGDFTGIKDENNLSEKILVDRAMLAAKK